MTLLTQLLFMCMCIQCILNLKRPYGKWECYRISCFDRRYLIVVFTTDYFCLQPIHTVCVAHKLIIQNRTLIQLFRIIKTPGIYFQPTIVQCTFECFEATFGNENMTILHHLSEMLFFFNLTIRELSQYSQGGQHILSANYIGAVMTKNSPHVCHYEETCL